MLTTLIYRSLVNPELEQACILKLVHDARYHNSLENITGILIYDGVAFFQVLEGEESVIKTLFSRICSDPRHNAVVLVMRDYSAYRRFTNTGMRLFNTSEGTTDTIMEQIIALCSTRKHYLQDDRILRLAKMFLAQSGHRSAFSDFSSSLWHLEEREHHTLPKSPARLSGQPYQFALQPIVEALSGNVSSYEALMRSASGDPPDRFFESMDPDTLYRLDLDIKAQAFNLASQVLEQNVRLSVNLLPGVLSSIPDAVDTLLKQITTAGLRPEQIIIEVTETEVISNQDLFFQALKALRIAGAGFAIDDFGVGYSGLSLLARFQPDKLKIDRALIQDIHLSGVKQAIVRSIALCCEELGIVVVAEGVEKIEEWCFLESIGIHTFQGYLFSKPVMNGVMNIRWPVRNCSIIDKS